jgi:hypothetical protein
MASALALAGAGGVQAAQKTVTAAQGPVSAALTYQAASDRFGNPTYSHEVLKIARAGATFYEAPAKSPACSPECDLETFGGGPLQVSELEGAGSPSVVLTLNTGGAHCCTIAQIFSPDPGTSTPRMVERDFGDPGVEITDVAGDGRLELQTADDRFAYLFESFAYSGLPIQILRLREGRLVDSTREFPAAVAADAARQLKAFVANRRAGFGLGFAAAWAADEALLGRSAQAFARLRREAHAGRLRSSDPFSPPGGRFVSLLRRRLHKLGYV